MEVMLRKSLVLKIKKTLAMASKHNFRALFGVFWSHFIQMVLFFQSISLNKKHGVKCFHDLFEIKHTEFLHSCIFPLLYIVISEIGISSFLIIDLVRTNSFHFFDLSFPWKYWLRKKTHLKCPYHQNFYFLIWFYIWARRWCDQRHR